MQEIESGVCIGEIVKQDYIRTDDDLLNLHIIDWHRLNGSWQNELQAMKTICSWFVGRSAYTIIKSPLSQAPKRDDFPEWKHVGASHTHLASLYWNWFHWTQSGTLYLSDAPDFYGELAYPDGLKARFWGDIGKVSAQAFAGIQKHMKEHDIWISVCDDEKQVIIEALDDLQSIYIAMFGIHSKQALLELEEQRT